MKELGSLNIIRGKYTVAEQHFRDALAIDSTDAQVHRYFAYLFAEQKRFSEAEKFAQKSLSLDPGFSSHNLFSWILIAGELDLVRGLELGQKALDLRPGYQPRNPYVPSPEHTLGLAYLTKGQYQKAVEYLEQAAKLVPNRQVIRDHLQLAKKKLNEMSAK